MSDYVKSLVFWAFPGTAKLHRLYTCAKMLTSASPYIGCVAIGGGVVWLYDKFKAGGDSPGSAAGVRVHNQRIHRLESQMEEVFVCLTSFKQVLGGLTKSCERMANVVNDAAEVNNQQNQLLAALIYAQPKMLEAALAATAAAAAKRPPRCYFF